MDTTEAEQVEAMKLWWKDHGAKVLGAIAISAIVYFGWQFWSAHQLQKRTHASEAYSQMAVYLEEGDIESFEQLSTDLMADYPDFPYASFSSLLKAKLAIDAEDYDQALTHLQWVDAHANDPVVADMSRIRQARIYLVQDNGIDALHVLDRVRSDVYQMLVMELRGDAHLLLDSKSDAIASYKLAAVLGGQAAVNQGRLPFVLMKLNDLGVSAEEATKKQG